MHSYISVIPHILVDILLHLDKNQHDPVARDILLHQKEMGRYSCE